LSKRKEVFLNAKLETFSLNRSMDLMKLDSQITELAASLKIVKWVLKAVLVNQIMNVRYWPKADIN